MFEYRVVVLDVHDGDSFKGDVDLGKTVFLPGRQPDNIDMGFNFHLRIEPDGINHRLWLADQAFRLNRLNTPEVTGEQKPLGLVSRDFVRSYLHPGAVTYVRTTMDKHEKFGRMLADVYPEGLDGPCLNDIIIEKGFGKPWDGNGARPV